MICPNCDNVTYLHSPNAVLHAVRIVYGSRRRYCPHCGKKWIMKSRYPSRVARELFLVLIMTGTALLVYFLFDRMSPPRELSLKTEYGAANTRGTRSGLTGTPFAGSAGSGNVDSLLGEARQLLGSGAGGGGSVNIAALQNSSGNQAELMSRAKQLMAQHGMDPNRLTPEMMSQAQQQAGRFQSASPEQQKKMIETAKKRFL